MNKLCIAILLTIGLLVNNTYSELVDKSVISTLEYRSPEMYKIMLYPIGISEEEFKNMRLIGDDSDEIKKLVERIEQLEKQVERLNKWRDDYYGINIDDGIFGDNGISIITSSGTH